MKKLSLNKQTIRKMTTVDLTELANVNGGKSGWPCQLTLTCITSRNTACPECNTALCPADQ